METKEMVVLVGKHSGNCLISEDTVYFRFFFKKDEKCIPCRVNRKSGETTKNVFVKLFQQFLEEGKLISVEYSTYKQREEYLGLKLQNAEETRFNVYFTSNALSAFTEFEKYIGEIKVRDFCAYANHPIEKIGLIVFLCVLL